MNFNSDYTILINCINYLIGIFTIYNLIYIR